MRKIYVLVAEKLKASKPREPGPCMEQWRDDVLMVAVAFRAENERFKFGAFYEACTLERRDL
jgi:hypothetical protein